MFIHLILTDSNMQEASINEDPVVVIFVLTRNVRLATRGISQ